MHYNQNRLKYGCSPAKGGPVHRAGVEEVEVLRVLQRQHGARLVQRVELEPPGQEVARRALALPERSLGDFGYNASIF